MNLRTITTLALLFGATVDGNAKPTTKNETPKRDTRQQQNSATRNSGANAQRCNTAPVAKYKYTNYSQNYSYNRPAAYQYNTVPVGYSQQQSNR